MKQPRLHSQTTPSWCAYPTQATPSTTSADIKRIVMNLPCGYFLRTHAIETDTLPLNGRGEPNHQAVQSVLINLPCRNPIFFRLWHRISHPLILYWGLWEVPCQHGGRLFPFSWSDWLGIFFRMLFTELNSAFQINCTAPYSILIWPHSLRILCLKLTPWGKPIRLSINGAHVSGCSTRSNLPIFGTWHVVL